jgi:PAS domain S-box-containing protein
LTGVVAQRAAEARAGAVLRASEERLRRTVEAAADGLLVFDAAGRLTLFNAAAERLLGVPQADLVDATAREVAMQLSSAAPPDASGGPAQLAAALVARQAPPPTEVTLRGPDGTQRSVQVSGLVLDADTPPGGLVVNLHEVTADRTLGRERAAHLEGLQAAAQAAAGSPASRRSWPRPSTSSARRVSSASRPGLHRRRAAPSRRSCPRISATSSARCPRTARCVSISGACRAQVWARRSSLSAAPTRSSWCRSPMVAPWLAPCWPVSAGGPSRSAPTRGRI